MCTSEENVMSGNSAGRHESWKNWREGKEVALPLFLQADLAIYHSAHECEISNVIWNLRFLRFAFSYS